MVISVILLSTLNIKIQYKFRYRDAHYLKKLDGDRLQISPAHTEGETIYSSPLTFYCIKDHSCQFYLLLKKQTSREKCTELEIHSLNFLTFLSDKTCAIVKAGQVTLNQPLEYMERPHTHTPCTSARPQEPSKSL